MKILKWILFVVLFIPGLIAMALAWIFHILKRGFKRAEDGLLEFIGWIVALKY